MPLPSSLSGQGDDEGSSLREHAFETLWRAIAEGTLEPGEALAEVDLVAWLGMSRQPIRHALVRLSDLGLMELANGKQPRVAALDPVATNATLMLSTFLDADSIRKTIGRLSVDDLARLDDAVAGIDRSESSGDPTRMAEWIREFHAVFHEAMGNQVLLEQTRLLTLELARFLVPGASKIDRAALPVVYAALLTAVKRGDRDGALAVLRQFGVEVFRAFVVYRRGSTS